jgi:hypothetical protein
MNLWSKMVPSALKSFSCALMTVLPSQLLLKKINFCKKTLHNAEIIAKGAKATLHLNFLITKKTVANPRFYQIKTLAFRDRMNGSHGINNQDQLILA